MQKRTIHKSLLRLQTFLGCDRELCMLMLMVAITIAISNLSAESITLATLFFICGFFLLHKMAKSDILLRQVYLRYLRYQLFYSAQAYSDNSHYRG